MKKIKHLILTVALLFVATISVNALDESLINKTDTKATFSHSYQTEQEAKVALDEFEEYVKNNKGILVSSKTTKIIKEINEEILKDQIDALTIEEINDQIASLESYYESIATEDSECKVVLDELKTIITPVRTEEEESGIIAPYVGNELAANMIAYFAWLANRNDYISYTPQVSARQLIYWYVNSNINEEFLSEEERTAYLEDNYSNYDLSNVTLSERVDREDLDSPKEEFSSLDEIDEYKEELENDGYIVNEGKTVAYVRENADSKVSVNETGLSQQERDNKLADLYQNYDNVNVSVLTDTQTVQNHENVSETFDEEIDAENYINDLKSKYIVVSSSITPVTTQVTTEVPVTKYYSTDANGAVKVTEYSEDITANDIDDDRLNVAGRGFSNLTGSGRVTVVEPGWVWDNRYNGTYELDEILVNGEQYNGGEIPAYAIVTVTGHANYTTGFGAFARTHTINFSKTGFLTDSAYVLYNINTDGTFTDNMIEVYKKTSTETITEDVTTYEASAEYYENITNTTYSIIGKASNNETVYETQIEAYKLITKYLANGTATMPLYTTYYVVSYDAVKEVWTEEVSYTQPYKVVETKEVSYLAEAEAKFEEEKVDEIKAPNTGVADTSTNYIALFLSIIAFGIYEGLKITLKDQK